MGLGSVPGAVMSSLQSRFLKDKSGPSQWLQGRGKREERLGTKPRVSAWESEDLSQEVRAWCPQSSGRKGLEDIRDSSTKNGSERPCGPGSGYQLLDLGGDPKGESAKT